MLNFDKRQQNNGWYLFKVDNKVTRTHSWRFIIPFVEFVNFEQISLMVTEPP